MLNEGAALSEGVSLLLQRMKSHPEEFNVEHGRWSDVLVSVYHRAHATGNATAVIGVPPDAWMSPSEVEAIWHEYVQLKQKRFHSWVMEKLLTNDVTEDKHFSVGAFAQGKRIPRTLMQNAATAIQPGSWQEVATQTSNTSIAQKLKDKLNNI
jgi:hypothetical protein